NSFRMRVMVPDTYYRWNGSLSSSGKFMRRTSRRVVYTKEPFLHRARGTSNVHVHFQMAGHRYLVARYYGQRIKRTATSAGQDQGGRPGYRIRDYPRFRDGGQGSRAADAGTGELEKAVSRWEGAASGDGTSASLWPSA